MRKTASNPLKRRRRRIAWKCLQTETEEPKQRAKKERRKKIAVKKMKVNERKKEIKIKIGHGRDAPTT